MICEHICYEWLRQKTWPKDRLKGLNLGHRMICENCACLIVSFAWNIFELRVKEKREAA
jgi:hypothetical protein